IYVSYWVKYSANWIGSTKTYHPHEFHVITDQDGAWVGPSTTHLTTYIEQNYQQGGVPRLAIQDALNIDTTKINVDLTGITAGRGTGTREAAISRGPGGSTRSCGRRPGRRSCPIRAPGTRETGTGWRCTSSSTASRGGRVSPTGSRSTGSTASC